MARNDPDGGSGSATFAQLRNDIDNGRTSDKVSCVDPAAAPLGTDEEAAGTPCPPEAIAMARRYETGRAARIAGEQRSSHRLFYVGAAALIVLLAWLVGR